MITLRPSGHYRVMTPRTFLPGLLSVSLLAFALTACTIYEDGGGSGGEPWPPEVPDAGWNWGVDGGSALFPDAGSWPPRDGGSAPFPDAGSWPPRDGGSAPFPDAGIWPPSDGGPGPFPDAGSWPPSDAGPAFRCSDITNEAICVVTPGCNALYQGVDCTCDSSGVCVCDHWIFDSCD